MQTQSALALTLTRASKNTERGFFLVLLCTRCIPDTLTSRTSGVPAALGRVRARVKVSCMHVSAT